MSSKFDIAQKIDDLVNKYKKDYHITQEAAIAKLLYDIDIYCESINRSLDEMLEKMRAIKAREEAANNERTKPN